MESAKGLIITGVVTLAVLIGGAVLLSKGGANTNAPAKPVIVDSSILVKDDSHQTKKGAKVTVVEFGDFQCPACQVVYPVTKELMRNYGEKINFVFRNFPLPQHRNAQIAAEAAEAANSQGKFWEMHDRLYEKQAEWDTKDNPIDVFLAWAKDFGLDVKKFKSQVENKEFAKVIDSDTVDGTTAGVSATPTFFINGQLLSGGATLDQFKSLIDPLLK